MNWIDEDTMAVIRFKMTWQGSDTRHTEIYYAQNFNFWRDFIPDTLRKTLAGKEVGDQLEFHLNADDFITLYDPRKHFSVKQSQFYRTSTLGNKNEPRVGRFYPKGLLKNIVGVFPQNTEPFRCVGIQNGHLDVDFNHPLAGKDIHLSLSINQIKSKESEHGGISNAWIDMMATGPGMQARWKNHLTDFFSDHPFQREDEDADPLFYNRPRFVQHVDERALQVIQSIYGRHLTDGMQVMDLMSSWVSHVPESICLKRLTGLGLNHKELERNSRLTDFRVHDLNQIPDLSYPSETYDAVICTVSIEYLIHPEEVFQDIARILKPNGKFIITVSNRWFPPKAIKIWKELHEFERLGLILEYFLRSNKFKHLESYSVRGLPRPLNDKYFPQMLYSDPVFAVWGQKI